MPLTSQFETTITHGNRLPGSLAGTSRSGSTPQDPHTPLSTPPLHHGGGRSARKAPPFARSQSQAGAGGGSTRPREGKACPGDWSWRRRQPGKGAAVQQGRWSPPARTEPRRGGLRGKRRGGGQEGPRLQVGAGTPQAPTPGGRVTLGKLLWRPEGRTRRPRPRAENPEEEKSCQASGPASRAARPAPSPPAARAGAAPPPARRPLARPTGHAPCLLAPLTETSRPPFPTHLPGRLRRSPLTPPAATVHTHTASGPALTLPHSHTARPRLQSGPHIMRHSRVTCPTRARARASPNLARGSLAGGGRRTPARAED